MAPLFLKVTLTAFIAQQGLKMQARFTEFVNIIGQTVYIWKKKQRQMFFLPL